MLLRGGVLNSSELTNQTTLERAFKRGKIAVWALERVHLLGLYLPKRVLNCGFLRLTTSQNMPPSEVTRFITQHIPWSAFDTC